MATEMMNSVVADVKCYYCGHVSGQIVGSRHEPLRVTNFVPRPGYKGPEVKPGTRLRCERCQGPVFLEDASSAVASRTSTVPPGALVPADSCSVSDIYGSPPSETTASRDTAGGDRHPPRSSRAPSAPRPARSSRTVMGR